MNKAQSHSLSSSIMRWVARLWSLLLAAFAVTMAVTPDPSITEPVPAEDWFLLGFWAVAVLGLLIAWRWEVLGPIVAMAAMSLRELAWVVLKGRWIVSFLIVWALILPPALLFLAAHRLGKNRPSHASTDPDGVPPQDTL